MQAKEALILYPSGYIRVLRNRNPDQVISICFRKTEMVLDFVPLRGHRWLITDASSEDITNFPAIEETKRGGYPYNVKGRALLIKESEL